MILGAVSKLKGENKADLNSQLSCPLQKQVLYLVLIWRAASWLTTEMWDWYKQTRITITRASNAVWGATSAGPGLARAETWNVHGVCTGKGHPTTLPLPAVHLNQAAGERPVSRPSREMTAWPLADLTGRRKGSPFWYGRNLTTRCSNKI